MKILFTQDALVNAGAERSHLEILSRFSPDVEVLMVYFYPKHDLKEEYQNAGIRLHFLDIPEFYHFPLAIYRLVRLIRREKPDLLISSLWRADIVTRMASLITGVSLVGTLVNDSYSPLAWTDKKGLKYKLVYWLDRLSAGIPIHWIANAQALADSHRKTLALKREKISVVYRGRVVPVSPWLSGASEVPIAIGRAKQSDSGEQRLEIERSEIGGLSRITNKKDQKGAFRFLSYGRLLERKGFQDAILAFSEVVKLYPDCRLTIYGEGIFRKNLEDLVLSLDLPTNVKLPGKVADPTDLLTTDHCFLFPSWYEGFSGALVEAMISGIPIIASDIPMNLEAVTAEKSALIFPIKNVEALTQRMLFAIKNPDLMAELGNAARLEAIQRFDIEKIAKEYEAVLLKVFQRNGN